MHFNLIVSFMYMNEKGKERTCLLLGMVEEKFYHRHVGEHSPRQEHLGRVQSGHNGAKLGRVGSGEGRRERGTRCSNQV